MEPNTQSIDGASQVSPQGQQSARSLGLVTCPGCGEAFQQTRTNRRHCRPSCRAAVGRQKHDEKIREEVRASLPLPFHQAPPEPVSDSRTIGTVIDEKTRAGKQCDRILAKLETGRASNRELAEIALKYTGRISELRDRGHNIKAIPQGGGLTIYELQPPAQRELEIAHA